MLLAYWSPKYSHSKPWSLQQKPQRAIFRQLRRQSDLRDICGTGHPSQGVASSGRPTKWFKCWAMGTITAGLHWCAPEKERPANFTLDIDLTSQQRVPKKENDSYFTTNRTDQSNNLVGCNLNRFTSSDDSAGKLQWRLYYWLQKSKNDWDLTMSPRPTAPPMKYGTASHIVYMPCTWTGLYFCSLLHPRYRLRMMPKVSNNIAAHTWPLLLIGMVAKIRMGHVPLLLILIL
jgi:hypothetical protein